MGRFRPTESETARSISYTYSNVNSRTDISLRRWHALPRAKDARVVSGRDGREISTQVRGIDSVTVVDDAPSENDSEPRCVSATVSATHSPSPLP